MDGQGMGLDGWLLSRGICLTWYCTKYQRSLTEKDLALHHCLQKRLKFRITIWGKSRSKRCPKCLRL